MTFYLIVSIHFENETAEKFTLIVPAFFFIESGTPCTAMDCFVLSLL